MSFNKKYRLEIADMDCRSRILQELNFGAPGAPGVSAGGGNLPKLLSYLSTEAPSRWFGRRCLPTAAGAPDRESRFRDFRDSGFSDQFQKTFSVSEKTRAPSLAMKLYFSIIKTF